MQLAPTLAPVFGHIVTPLRHIQSLKTANMMTSPTSSSRKKNDVDRHLARQAQRSIPVIDKLLAAIRSGRERRSTRDIAG